MCKDNNKEKKNSGNKLKQCWLVVISFFKTIKEIIVPPKNDDMFVSLAPTKNADKDGTYSRALKYAIENKEIQNIAISGIYGSGKSSVIRTFFSKLENKKYNPIFVSLAAFNKNDYYKNNDDGEGQEEYKNEFHHALEKSILQQLFYQAKGTEVPLSRFKRIDKHSKFWISIATIAIFILGFVICCMTFPQLVNGSKESYEIITQGKNKGIWNTIIGISIISAFVFLYKAVFVFRNKFNISKLKIKDAEVEIDGKVESIFNKYLDEIIYFFQVTNHRVVVIEDLDRFEGDASFVFQKLRELNTLINSSKHVKQEVDFIFAIKDDFFKDNEERTKFFEYIIPIIPISSKSNSNELMWKRLEYIKSKGKVTYKFDKNFIDDISLMIEDKRLIDNIINEFIIYKSKIIGDHLDDKQLFSIVVYKNINPNEYVMLQKNKGDIVQVFNNKKEKVKNLVKKLSQEKEELRKNKEAVKKELFKTTKELKLALVASIYRLDISYNYSRLFVFDRETMDINSFYSESVNSNKIANSNVSFRIGNGISLDEKNTFEAFGNKASFVKRMEVIEKGTDKELEEIQNKVEVIDNKINEIEKKTIKELVQEYGDEDIFDSNTDTIVKYLIKEGYVTEDYKDYITLFIPGNLTQSDVEFIYAVKTGEKLAWGYKLDKKDNIIKRLSESDFEKESILNFDLLDYIVQKELTNKELAIMRLLNQDKQEELAFIDEFIKEYNPSEEFIEKLVKQVTTLWKKVYQKIGNKEYVDKWLIRFLKNEDSIENVDDSFTEYINKHTDLDKYVEDSNSDDIVNSLEILGVKLSNIKKISNKEFMTKIYEKRLFELNSNMIKLFLEMNSISTELFNTMNLKIIMSNKNIIKEDVLNYFDEYYNQCYTLNDSNDDDEKSIMEVLKNENIKTETKKKIIKNENFNKYDIRELHEELIDEIVNEEKLKPTYDNVLTILSLKGMLDQDLVNHISKNINYYRNQNLSEYKEQYGEDIVNQFINQYIYSEHVKLKDFGILVDTFDIVITELKEIENEKLKYIIEQKLVEFNQHNFNYIKNHLPDYLVGFIINNINIFTDNIKDYDFSNITEELLMAKEITSDNKIKILKAIDMSQISNNTIQHLILDDKLYFKDKNINERVIQDEEIQYSARLDILKRIIKNEDDKLVVKEYIHLMKNGYEDISTQKSVCNIKKSYIDDEMCEILKSQGYISSSKDGKRNNKLLYNKGSNV